ncbi:hypothetical protein EMPS_04334 [Entomortierella parvispora]|uniref:Uncharacterized protein n=1 Tax=Entomortierella parvispora TaxID=205924 RepID=A0A9P3LVF3_9FUNG|nr:hypothetical protein EMPS_04334 [Entomortierella parvispora]
MDNNTPYDDWSKHIHAVITFLQPFFNDWRSYARLVSTLLGVGVLIMENQVLLRMRMGRWEIAGYVVWCSISAVLGPLFDIVVMVGLFIYCRRKSNRMHITNESIAKALLPAPVAQNYRFMGLVCIAATVLTLFANVLYMLRGWKDPSLYFDWASNILRWTTSQIWYAIAMIFLFHVVTRPAQSGVVFFGKFPRDLWAHKWYLCILYVPVHYMLLELCNIHRETKQILIPLEIIVDVLLYNGPFLLVLLRLLFLGWKVAYDEAVLTGAVYEDQSAASTPMDGGGFTSSNRRATSGARPGSNGYVGLAMVDLEDGHAREANISSEDTSRTADAGKPVSQLEDVYVLEDDDEDEGHSSHLAGTPIQTQSPRKGSPVKSSLNSPSKSPSKKSVVFDMDEETDEDEDLGPTAPLTASSPDRRDADSLV